MKNYSLYSYNFPKFDHFDLLFLSDPRRFFGSKKKILLENVVGERYKKI